MRRLRRRNDERGVMAILVALLTCFTLIPMAAVAVDLGVQRVARRDLQNVADLVALDLARGLNGQPYSQVITGLQADADKSAARSTVAGDPPHVTPQLGKINPALWSPTDPNPAGYFTPINSDADGIPNAVRVAASTTVHFSFVSGDGGAGGTGNAARTSIAYARDSACFSLGSFAARVSTSGSVLNGLMSDALDLGVVDYRGLAYSSIKLNDLATELHVGTPDELMSTSVTLNQLLTAMAHVFQNNGTTSGGGSSSANLTLLNSLAAANFSSVTHTSFTLDQLFSLSSGHGSVAATTVNLYDLLAATAFVANGSSFLSIPSFNALGGVVTGSLKVIQKPVVTCGPVGTTQDTSQIDLQLSVKLPSTSLLALFTTDGTLTVTAKVGQATGTLTSITCKPGYPTGIDVGVTSALSQLTTTLQVYVKSIANLARFDTGSGATVSGSSSTVSIQVPSDSYGVPKETGTGPAESQVSNVTSANGTLLGILPLGVTLSTLASAINSSVITATVNPLLVNLNGSVITPLTQALGIRLGGADVTLPEAPQCGQVALAG